MVMTDRLVSRIQGTYVPAIYDGKNNSGVIPLVNKVLVRTDEFSEITKGGVYVTEVKMDNMTMASESGVIVDVGPDAFSIMPSGHKWASRKPTPGDHIYYDKYAGLLVMGNDGKTYRLMDDGCIGAIYSVYGEEEEIKDTK